MRWLSPLPAGKIAKAVEPCKNVLIVDECRKTGSPSEEIMTALAEHDCAARIKRITGEDCFIPLGPAADQVLLSEAQIKTTAMSLVKKSSKRAAE